jgi:hypothetical protein
VRPYFAMKLEIGVAVSMDHLVSGATAEVRTAASDDLARTTIRARLAAGERLAVVKIVGHAWATGLSAPALRDRAEAAGGRGRLAKALRLAAGGGPVAARARRGRGRTRRPTHRPHQPRKRVVSPSAAVSNALSLDSHPTTRTARRKQKKHNENQNENAVSLEVSQRLDSTLREPTRRKRHRTSERSTLKVSHASSGDRSRGHELTLRD